MTRLRYSQVRCPYCQQLFDRDAIEAHIAARHGNVKSVVTPLRVIAAVLTFLTLALIAGEVLMAYQRGVLGW